MFLGWADADQDKALAWQAEQDAACPGCGFPLAETTDDDTRHLWEASAVVCAVCEHKAVLVKSLSEDPSASTDGLIVSVRKGDLNG